MVEEHTQGGRGARAPSLFAIAVIADHVQEIGYSRKYVEPGVYLRGSLEVGAVEQDDEQVRHYVEQKADEGDHVRATMGVSTTILRYPNGYDFECLITEGRIEMRVDVGKAGALVLVCTNESLLVGLDVGFVAAEDPKIIIKKGGCLPRHIV